MGKQARRSGSKEKTSLKKKEKEETINTLDRLMQEAIYTTKGQIIGLSGFLSSQVYLWQREIKERKKRMSQIYAEEVNAAADNILSYPHMGGKKGTLTMAYHQIEYIGQRYYDFLKKQLKQIVSDEIKRRHLERPKISWPKVAAKDYGEIWCADFTNVTLYGQILYIAVVLDDYSHYYLGYNISDTADSELVDGAFTVALKTCQGVLPELFMVNDRGNQYKAELYMRHVEEYNIKHVFIPKGTPWNNGEAEVGMKDIKALFYQRLSQTPKDRRQDIVDQAQEMAKEIFKELNEQIPRPKLQGVTPKDIVTKKAEAKRAGIRSFIEEQKVKRETKTRIYDLNKHLLRKLYLENWSDRYLKNMFHLINHQYQLIVPEKVRGNSP